MSYINQQVYLTDTMQPLNKQTPLDYIFITNRYKHHVSKMKTGFQITWQSLINFSTYQQITAMCL